MGKASETGGVKPMKIAGRLVSERERLSGMTDAERAFRKQWLQDQILAPNEPRPVPQIYQATYNPIRRFYRWPMNLVQQSLAPLVGAEKALVFRIVTSKVAMVVTAAYVLYYNYKYHGNEWERRGGWRSYISRPAVLPGDPGYPAVPERVHGHDYASRGFKNVTLNL